MKSKLSLLQNVSKQSTANWLRPVHCMCGMVWYRTSRVKVSIHPTMYQFNILPCWLLNDLNAQCISRVPDQNGVSQAWYIVEIHYSGRESSISCHDQGGSCGKKSQCFPSLKFQWTHAVVFLCKSHLYYLMHLLPLSSKSIFALHKPVAVLMQIHYLSDVNLWYWLPTNLTYSSPYYSLT